MVLIVERDGCFICIQNRRYSDFQESWLILNMETKENKLRYSGLLLET